MRVTVGPRVVAAPWELEQRTARRAWVGREAEVTPEPGPLALYRAVFPDRVVRWNVERQLFEIVSTDPTSGFHEFIFWWDAAPDPADNDREFSAEEIAEMVDQGSGRVVKRWAPFDYGFVWRRLRERWEWEGLGAQRERKFVRRIADHNANVQRTHLAQQQATWDEWAKDDRRWLPVLAELSAGARPDVALTEKIPLQPVGIDLATPAGAT